MRIDDPIERPPLTGREKASARRMLWRQFRYLCQTWPRKPAGVRQGEILRIIREYEFMDEEPPPEVYTARLIMGLGRHDLEPTVPDKKVPKPRPKK